ncbi:uncharacterized protein LOC132369657 [Balaenoptera ricei]|uniref:uncharacterized protein LOC132369657 n=1 Tax=Balaenoptera ricei TaxID=2746895 RepID=UPI0028BF1C0B|nr:uncharacterized protein LOC132369657 [Balaenoptera ricei]XP_059785323.1 uncharacterized protein LOC132369657 [Balaenoptera ricei]
MSSKAKGRKKCDQPLQEPPRGLPGLNSTNSAAVQTAAHPHGARTPSPWTARGLLLQVARGWLVRPGPRRTSPSLGPPLRVCGGVLLGAPSHHRTNVACLQPKKVGTQDCPPCPPHHPRGRASTSGVCGEDEGLVHSPHLLKMLNGRSIGCSGMDQTQVSLQEPMSECQGCTQATVRRPRPHARHREGMGGTSANLSSSGITPEGEGERQKEIRREREREGGRDFSPFPGGSLVQPRLKTTAFREMGPRGKVK